MKIYPAMTLIIIALVSISYYGGYKHGFSDGMTEADNNFSRIQYEWLHKTVVATGDYFDVFNGNITKFRGEVIAVTVRPWGTFIAVYNGSTKTLYPEERIEYFSIFDSKP